MRLQNKTNEGERPSFLLIKNTLKPMTQDYFKYFNSKTLPFLMVGIYMLLGLAKENWHLSISIFAVLSTFIMAITTFLWKFFPFKYLFWVDNFSGRYEGILQYHFTDNDGNQRTGQLKHVKIVKQNGHLITIHSFTIKDDGSPSSPSENKGMYIEKTNCGNHFNLIYNYMNQGSTENGFPPHYGTDVLKFIRIGKDKILTGCYYTNRNPQTKGFYKELIWVSNDLNHEF